MSSPPSIDQQLRELIEAWRRSATYTPGSPERRAWTNACQCCAKDLELLVTRLLTAREEKDALRPIAEAFVAYHTGEGLRQRTGSTEGCSNCGMAIHSRGCFVGQFESSLRARSVPPEPEPPRLDESEIQRKTLTLMLEVGEKLSNCHNADAEGLYALSLCRRIIEAETELTTLRQQGHETTAQLEVARASIRELEARWRSSEAALVEERIKHVLTPPSPTI